MIPRAHPLSGGLVIMLEGIDGVGKTTQLELIKRALEDAGWPVMATRNLGGTPIGEALRDVILSPVKRPPMTDFYVSLAIQEPLLDLIDSARAEGKIVLMDRGPLSLAAYQIYGSEIPESVGWQYVKTGMERIRPEAVILYDTDVKTASKRLSTAKSDYFESKSPQYFERVAEGYREVARRFDTVTVIDASQDIKAIHDQTSAAITRLLA